MRRREFLGACGIGLVGFSAVPAPSRAEGTEEVHRDFDVIIAGGTTAAFAAAVASAESGARTCLIEPTDWVGGQLTASAVPAIDEAWHTIKDKKTGEEFKVHAIARDRANMTPNFRAMLDATGNPGKGWVSNYCFEPRNFLDDHLLPLEAKLVAEGTLVVFREAVIKTVEVDAARGLVTAITAIRRKPRPGVEAAGYDVLPSKDLADWYSPEPSSRFDKSVLRFEAPRGRDVVFIDATEWGEVLVLADAPYLQGVEFEDGGREGDDRCGQSTVYDFVQRYAAEPADEPAGPEGVSGFGFDEFDGKAEAWNKIWTYRRIKSARGGGPAAVGDLCLQNWGYSAKLKAGGNDYPFGYLFLSRAEADAQRGDWNGGVDLAVLSEAERRALGWHHWFKAQAPEGIDPRQILLDGGVLGTSHGLAKLPYIRDTRRSVGLDGFLLKGQDLNRSIAKKTGRRFFDRVALGAYPSDVHPMSTCTMPAYIVQAHDTLPFYIPFRSLTNEKYGNLLVAGKTMAQSFLANAATRLHPIEWSSGTAAGVAAADMARNGRTSREELEQIEHLQALVRRKTPTEWTIEGKLYPDPEADKAE
ncbi:FAD-dependent oxidoreductase [Planctomyces sp. SH-PL62]|uniref:FAD-dependent oxidoreductase n=1 Tax=Planctomyces sp. SH-PL62 TaxID=1636152 RepID=UPI00078B2906|nr:FAD-dependent oxidoreductase [Planctomyces sp. SH-PL62]AMV37447.1 FAD dependent oxidoreductase [Planctomyces sp. SH-PL62]